MLICIQNMTLSNFLTTPEGVTNNKNSGEPEPEKAAPGSVQFRRLEVGIAGWSDWVKQQQMNSP